MSNLLNEIKLDSDLEFVITSLEVKLNEFKKRKPEGDYKAQEKMIEILKSHRINHLEMREENRILNKKYRSEVMLNERYKQAMDKCNSENENLRKNVQGL